MRRRVGILCDTGATRFPIGLARPPEVVCTHGGDEVPARASNALTLPWPTAISTERTFSPPILATGSIRLTNAEPEQPARRPALGRLYGGGIRPYVPSGGCPTLQCC
jgi:hypothetical protein